MAVKILFFAQAADWAGRRELVCELDGQVSLSELLSRPELKGIVGRLRGTRFTLNQEYADPEAWIRDGDEVGVLPPVSGG